MAIEPKNGSLIYHLTSIDNLESIIKDGLCARSKVDRFDDVADEEIIEFRKANGMLKYIPFHFFAPSPFAGVVQKTHPTKSFFYLCLSRKTARRQGFKIVPKHPIALDRFQIYDYDKGFSLIDWERMKERNYHDVECKHICMAECLTDNELQIESFDLIFVKNRDTELEIKKTYREMRGRNLTVKILEQGAFFPK